MRTGLRNILFADVLLRFTAGVMQRSIVREEPLPAGLPGWAGRERSGFSSMMPESSMERPKGSRVFFCGKGMYRASDP
jgi:hypothetical protein